MTVEHIFYTEGEDYELVPPADLKDDEAGWHLRILTGEYVETVLTFGNVSLDGTDPDEDDPKMSFNFEIVTTPDPDLSTEDEDFQHYAGDLLLSLIERSIKEQTMQVEEKAKPVSRRS